MEMKEGLCLTMYVWQMSWLSVVLTYSNKIVVFPPFRFPHAKAPQNWGSESRCNGTCWLVTKDAMLKLEVNDTWGTHSRVDSLLNWY